MATASCFAEADSRSALALASLRICGSSTTRWSRSELKIIATLRRKVTRFAMLASPSEAPAEGAETSAPAEDGSSTATVVDGSVLEDAYQALMSIGHSPLEARNRLDKVFAAKTRDEWQRLNGEHDAGISPVLDYTELLGDQHMAESGMVNTVQHPTLGEVRQLATPRPCFPPTIKPALIR